MNPSLHRFLLSCLPTTIGASERAEESELTADWRELLVELAAVSPDMVTYILPQLEGVVSMEDENIRLQV